MERVLQMIGSLGIGGSQAMVMNLYRNINREKIQFDFIIDHTDNLDYVEEIKQLGGKVYIMPSFVGINYLDIRDKWNTFFQEHPEYKILHSHVRSYASLYIPIAKKYGVTTIIHSHSTSNGVGFKSIIKKILQFPLRYQADYLFACSEESGKWLYGKSVVNNKKFSVVPNAIEINKYKFDVGIREQYRKEFNIEDKYVIGHVGRFHESKNHMFLLELFSEVVNKRSDAVLVLVGDGLLRSQIESKILELGIIDKVILLGNRNDVSSVLQMMDVFVFPSLWEGLPVTLIEAQAAGLPCIVSERITEEVVLTHLVNKVKLDLGAKKWSETIMDLEIGGRDVESQLELKKFDIKSTIEWIEEVYSSIINKNSNKDE